MSDTPKTDTPDDDGSVDYSQRDYQAPTGYRAPDFVSRWAAQDSRTDEARAEEAAEDAAAAADVDTAGPAREQAPAPDVPRTIDELESVSRAESAAQVPGIVLPGRAPGEGLVQDAADDADDAPVERKALLERVATDSQALLSQRAAAVQRGARSTADPYASEASPRGPLPPSGPKRAPAPARSPQSGKDSQGKGQDTGKTKGGGGWFAIVAAVLAIILAANSFSFVGWIVIIVSLIASIGLLRRGGGSRVLGILTLIATVIALVIQLVGSFGGPMRDAIPGLAGTSATLDLAGTASFSGEGNARLDVVLPSGMDGIGLLQVDFDGERIRVYDVDADGEQMGGSSLSEYDTFSGIAVLNEWQDDEFRAIDIEAEGSWTVTLIPLDAVPSFDSQYTGSGPEVVLYTGPGGAATFTFEPEQSVQIDTFGDDSWYQNLDQVTSLTRPFQAGPTLIRVEPYDDVSWSIGFDPNVPAPTPTQ